MKLQQVIRGKKNSRHGERFYTMVDMACIKHDEAVENSKAKRGQIKRTNHRIITVCGCGMEGCFLHVSIPPKN